MARFALSREPRGFDPGRNLEMIDAVLQAQLLEGLTDYDVLHDDGRVLGQLARSWSVAEDGRVWTFHLNPDASFHDPFDPPLWPERKRGVRAQDFVYCWLRQADTRSGCEGWWAFDGLLLGLDEFRQASADLDPEKAEAAWQAARKDGVEGLRALDDHTLQLTLKRPDPGLLQRLAMSYFLVYPWEAVETEGRTLMDQPVGSGPFVLHDWLPGQRVLLRRTPAWRRELSPFDGITPLPHLDAVEFHVVRDVKARQRMFLDGEVERLSVGRSAQREFLDADFQLRPDYVERGIRLHSWAMPDTTMLCFGMEDPVVGLVLGDEDADRSHRLLRGALALAFPRGYWSEKVRGPGHALDARGMLPPMVPGAAELEDSIWCEEDLERASELLVQAGYPQGRGLPTLEFLLPGTDPVTRSVGDAYAANLERIGVDCTPVPMAYEQQLERSRNADAQIFLRTWVMDWPAGPLLLNNFHGPEADSGINLTRFQSHAYDQAVEAYRDLADGEQRQALLRQLHRMLEEQVPAVALDHRRASLLVQPWLQDFRAHPQRSFFCRYYRIEGRP